MDHNKRSADWATDQGDLWKPPLARDSAKKRRKTCRTSSSSRRGVNLTVRRDIRDSSDSDSSSGFASDLDLGASAGGINSDSDVASVKFTKKVSPPPSAPASPAAQRGEALDLDGFDLNDEKDTPTRD